MTLRLKPGNGFIPSGHEFTDPRTGFKVCGYQLSADGAVRKLIEHRQANPSTYPPGEAQWFDFAVVRQEFFRAIYEKNPGLFRPVTEPASTFQFNNFESEKCSQCGSVDLDVQKCVTCGGNKFLKKQCRTCGFDMLANR